MPARRARRLSAPPRSLKKISRTIRLLSVDMSGSRKKTVDINDDEDYQPDDGIKWGEDHTGTEDSGDEALSRRSKAQKNRRRFKLASVTGKSRPSYAMRLAKMASSKFNLSGSIKETEAAE